MLDREEPGLNAFANMIFSHLHMPNAFGGRSFCPVHTRAIVVVNDRGGIVGKENVFMPEVID